MGNAGSFSKTEIPNSLMIDCLGLTVQESSGVGQGMPVEKIHIPEYSWECSVSLWHMAPLAQHPLAGEAEHHRAGRKREQTKQSRGKQEGLVRGELGGE